MRREWMLVVGGFVAGMLVATGWSARVDAQDRKTETKDLLKLDLGAWCPGKEVLISHLTNGVGGSGRHSHPAYSFTYVIEGAQSVTPDNGPAYTAHGGELQQERPGEISATRTVEPSKVLVFRIAEKGKPVTVPAK
jgi:hypothetical protein